MEVNVHEVKAHFSEFLKRVAFAEEIIITKAGTPVAKIVPVRSKALKLGSAKGGFVVPDHLNAA